VILMKSPKRLISVASSYPGSLSERRVSQRYEEMMKMLRRCCEEKNVKRFTGQEQAQNHCQIGNIGLSVRVIINWLDCLQDRAKGPHSHSAAAGESLCGPRSQNDHRCRVQAELLTASLDNGAAWHYALIRAITLMTVDSPVMKAAPGVFHKQKHAAISRRFSWHRPSLERS